MAYQLNHKSIRFYNRMLLFLIPGNSKSELPRLADYLMTNFVAIPAI